MDQDNDDMTYMSLVRWPSLEWHVTQMPFRGKVLINSYINLGLQG